jgi:hypothetical protein
MRIGALLLSAALALNGCRLNLAATGILSVRLGTAQPKTILPSIPPANSYRLSFSGPSAVEPLTFSDDTATEELPVGTWTVAVVALDSGGDSIAEGSKSGIDITAGATTSVALSLHALSGGTGSIDLRLSWPESQSIDTAASSLSLSLNGAAVSPAGTLSWEGSGLRYQLSGCGTGDYKVDVSLSNLTTKTAYSNTFVVQVFGNLTTSGEIALGIADFSLPPPPTNLGLSASYHAVHLEWSDNSGIERKYRVQRSADGSTYEDLATGLAASRRSYTDSGGSAGQTYLYRVLAVGDSGVVSAPSNSVSGSWAPAPQIIADHSVVDQYENIPPAYIALVKKMWLDLPGESHSGAYRTGLSDLYAAESKFAVSVTSSGQPEAATDSHLRVSRATWGDVDHTESWFYSYGEEDWFTSSTAIARTKAHLDYCNGNGYEISAMGFGWCWDMYLYNSSAAEDPVYLVHWYGNSLGGPEGDRCWGLDAGDQSLTANSVCMDTYLGATQAYVEHCAQQGYATKVFLTTGTVDAGYYAYYPLGTNEDNYQGYLKNERIRSYAKADSSRILFDYADILCYNDGSSSPNTLTFTDSGGTEHSFPFITSANVGTDPNSADHIAAPGRLRLAKALWWMLARMAGWDGSGG